MPQQLKYLSCIKYIMQYKYWSMKSINFEPPKCLNDCGRAYIDIKSSIGMIYVAYSR